MKKLISFTKKELTEHARSGKLIFMLILFTLFGIMNPAVAKLTPWLLETMSDSLAQSGMVITTVEVTAMDSWVQFYKNIPMALIVFVILESSIFTNEYRSGSLILSLTKGLERHIVIKSKVFVMLALWSVGYWLCFAITYGYNAYFWDNSVASCLGFSVLCWWLFGVWVIALVVFFSVTAKTNIGVLCGTGAVAFVSYLIGIIPKASRYVPTKLLDGNSLIYGIAEIGDYVPAIVLTAVVSVMLLAASIPIFNKKQL